jgi:hypothetical protein
VRKLYRIVGFRDEKTEEKYGDLLNKVVQVNNSIKVEINADTAEFWQEQHPNLEFGQIFTINYVFGSQVGNRTFGFYEDLPEMVAENSIQMKFLGEEEDKIV